MERNFTECPHCALFRKQKIIRPAIHGPLVSRSDARTFHLYLEESGLHSRSSDPAWEPRMQALFRYDLDTCSIKSESTLVTIQISEEDQSHELAKLEEAADRLAELLSRAEVPSRLYTMKDGQLLPVATPPLSGMIFAPKLDRTA